MLRISWGWILTILSFKNVKDYLNYKTLLLPWSVGEELSDLKDCNPDIEHIGDMEDIGGMVTPWPEVLSRRRLAAAQASAKVLMTLLMSIERLEIKCQVLVNM